ncbi:MAG: YdcF family protein [Hyphomicrobiales bacterium]
MRIKYKAVHWLFKTIHAIVMFFGVVAIIMLILSFTSIPYHAYFNLSAPKVKLHQNPDYIVTLSGSGMPSPDGMIKMYYAAKAAQKYPHAKVVIALPYNDGQDSLKQINIARHELLLHGIDSSRIQFEPKGYNTYSQARNIIKLIPHADTIAMMLITSPEHTSRSIKTFQKLGIKHIGGNPTYAMPISKDKLLSSDKAETTPLSIRYNMWNYLKYEIIALREYTAMIYYKYKGWI